MSDNNTEVGAAAVWRTLDLTGEICPMNVVRFKAFFAALEEELDNELCTEKRGEKRGERAALMVRVYFGNNGDEAIANVGRLLQLKNIEYSTREGCLEFFMLNA